MKNSGNSPYATYQWWCWEYFSTAVNWVQASFNCIAGNGTLANIYSRDQWIALQNYANSVGADSTVT